MTQATRKELDQYKYRIELLEKENKTLCEDVILLQEKFDLLMGHLKLDIQETPPSKKVIVKAGKKTTVSVQTTSLVDLYSQQRQWFFRAGLGR